MTWLSNWFYLVTHRNFDLNVVQQKIQAATASNADLIAYIDDLQHRERNMSESLRNLYKKYNIIFTGFKSLDMACGYLRDSINSGTEAAYNNLIKLESMVTGEQQRHLALIKLAITPNGKRVIDQIRQDQEGKDVFAKVFGEMDTTGQIQHGGLYSALWDEIHKLAEYVLLQKNRVYH